MRKLPHTALIALVADVDNRAMQRLPDGAPRPDASETANGRAVRAARLASIKEDILENLDSADLSETAVAFRQWITPRYVQLLFESEGTTFSKFVLEARLRRAHELLSDPRLAETTITAIAFAAGFGDLSYFNRAFRRHFGTTPTELRRTLRRPE